jgi:predicted ATPase
MISAEQTHRPIHSPNLLVGRTYERGRLREALAALTSHRGGLVLISGETGSGKTALTQILAHEAAERGVLVIQGRGYHELAARPYGLWRNLFAHWPEQSTYGHLSETVDVPLGDRIPVPDFDGYTASADKIALAAQLHNFFAAMVQGPLCIIFEELHWADAASLELLRHLAHRLTTKPILLVATYRDEGVGRHHPLYGLLPVLTRETAPLRLWLAPLDDTAVQTLIWTRYGLPPPRRSASVGNARQTRRRESALYHRVAPHL